MSIFNFNIPINVTCIEEYTVREEHIATHINGNNGVLSTPSMISFMEKTSMNCIQRYIPNEYTTVGFLVNVKHLNPAPLSSTLKVQVRIVSIEGRKIVLEVRAYLGETVIGEGVHERYIVNKEKFIEKLKKMAVF